MRFLAVLALAFSLSGCAVGGAIYIDAGPDAQDDAAQE